MDPYAQTEQTLASYRAMVPTSPEDAAALYKLLREEMRRNVVGHDSTLDRLALIGVQHMARIHSRRRLILRICLVGEAGMGKTLLSRTLAGALGVQTVYIPVGQLAEMNWSGTDLADYLGGVLGPLFKQHPYEVAFEMASHAVIILDDIHHLRLPGRYGSASTRDYQSGRQHSLLQVIRPGGTGLLRSPGLNVQWPSDRSLLITCGSFPGIGPRPGAGIFEDHGMIPELSDALAAGTVLRVQSLPTSKISRVLQMQVWGMRLTFQDFGYRLDVSEEAITYLADQLASGELEGGIQSGIASLRDTAGYLLTRMVRDADPLGTRRVLAPDDLEIRNRGKGVWRE